MSARPYSSSGVAPTIRISESGAIQKGHVRDSIDALAVAMAYTNPAACTVQRHAGATAAATFNAYDVEGRGFLDRGQMQSALSELGVLHGFTTAMIEDVLSQDPASSREQRYRLAEFLAMYERMALTQGKAARSAKRAAKAKAEVPAWAEKSPELKRVFEHYSAGYNAGPGVEMSNQQLTRMCGDIGVTGDGGVLTPAAPDLAFARVKETPNMRKLGFPQFLKALAVLSDESGFDLFSITSAHVGELTSGLAPPGGMLPHVGSGGEPVGAKPGNTSNTSNTSKTSNGLPLVVSPLQRGAAGAGPGGAFARHSMSGSPLRGHMSPGRIDSPSCKHSYDAMRRPSVGGGPSGAPGSPPTVAFKERFTGGAGAGPGTPLGSPSTRPSTSGGVPNSPGGQRQPRLLSSAGSVGVGGASANFAAGSAVVPSAWSSRPNTASLGSGPNGRPMLGGVAFSDDCMDSAVPITKMLAGAWHTLDLETAPPESIPPWLRQLLLRVSTLEAAAATGGGEDLVTRSAGGGFGGGGSDLALRVETLEGSVRHLQSAPLPEKTMATMASQLMLQLRPKAVEAANDAVSRMTADVQAASAAAAAAAAAAARLPANLADRVSACEARLDGHAGDLAAVTARTDEVQQRAEAATAAQESRLREAEKVARGAAAAVAEATAAAEAVAAAREGSTSESRARLAEISSQLSELEVTVRASAPAVARHEAALAKIGAHLSGDVRAGAAALAGRVAELETAVGAAEANTRATRTAAATAGAEQLAAAEGKMAGVQAALSALQAAMGDLPSTPGVPTAAQRLSELEAGVAASGARAHTNAVAQDRLAAEIATLGAQLEAVRGEAAVAAAAGAAAAAVTSCAGASVPAAELDALRVELVSVVQAAASEAEAWRAAVAAMGVHVDGVATQASEALSSGLGALTDAIEEQLATQGAALTQQLGQQAQQLEIQLNAMQGTIPAAAAPRAISVDLSSLDVDDNTRAQLAKLAELGVDPITFGALFTQVADVVVALDVQHKSMQEHWDKEGDMVDQAARALAGSVKATADAAAAKALAVDAQQAFTTDIASVRSELKALKSTAGGGTMSDGPVSSAGRSASDGLKSESVHELVGSVHHLVGAVGEMHERMASNERNLNLTLSFYAKMSDVRESENHLLDRQTQLHDEVENAKGNLKMVRDEIMEHMSKAVEVFNTSRTAVRTTQHGDSDGGAGVDFGGAAELQRSLDGLRLELEMRTNKTNGDVSRIDREADDLSKRLVGVEASMAAGSLQAGRADAAAVQAAQLATRAADARFGALEADLRAVHDGMVQLGAAANSATAAAAAAGAAAAGLSARVDGLSGSVAGAAESAGPSGSAAAAVAELAARLDALAGHVDGLVGSVRAGAGAAESAGAAAAVEKLAARVDGLARQVAESSAADSGAAPGAAGVEKLAARMDGLAKQVAGSGAAAAAAVETLAAHVDGLARQVAESAGAAESAGTAAAVEKLAARMDGLVRQVTESSGTTDPAGSAGAAAVADLAARVDRLAGRVDGVAVVAAADSVAAAEKLAVRLDGLAARVDGLAKQVAAGAAAAAATAPSGDAFGAAAAEAADLRARVDALARAVVASDASAGAAPGAAGAGLAARVDAVSGRVDALAASVAGAAAGAADAAAGVGAAVHALAGRVGGLVGRIDGLAEQVAEAEAALAAQGGGVGGGAFGAEGVEALQAAVEGAVAAVSAMEAGGAALVKKVELVEAVAGRGRIEITHRLNGAMDRLDAQDRALQRMRGKLDEVGVKAAQAASGARPWN